MTQRNEMLDDLPTAVARVGDDAGEPSHLTVEQHHVGPTAHRP